MPKDTQLSAWSELQETISEKRQKVLDAIKESERGAALFHLVKTLGWPVNRISGRVTELAKQKLIYDSGWRAINPDSGKACIVWKAR